MSNLNLLNGMTITSICVAVFLSMVIIGLPEVDPAVIVVTVLVMSLLVVAVASISGKKVLLIIYTTVSMNILNVLFVRYVWDVTAPTGLQLLFGTVSIVLLGAAIVLLVATRRIVHEALNLDAHEDVVARLSRLLGKNSIEAYLPQMYTPRYFNVAMSNVAFLEAAVILGSLAWSAAVLWTNPGGFMYLVYSVVLLLVYFFLTWSLRQDLRTEATWHFKQVWLEANPQFKDEEPSGESSEEDQGDAPLPGARPPVALQPAQAPAAG